MATKAKYSTIQQHQPLYAPKGWNEEEKRFVRTLQGILEDIYKRYGRLGLSDLSKVFRGTVNGLESGVASNQQSVTTLGEALALLSSTKLDQSALLDRVYPVGSLYLSVSAASPATLFGGTWERLKDRFLLAAGDAYPAGSTGGEAVHTLTVEEMPGHSHEQYFYGDTLNGSAGTNSLTAFAADVHQTDTAVVCNEQQPTGSTGGSAAHNNLPPYLAVYIWKRTA